MDDYLESLARVRFCALPKGLKDLPESMRNVEALHYVNSCIYWAIFRSFAIASIRKTGIGRCKAHSLIFIKESEYLNPNMVMEDLYTRARVRAKSYQFQGRKIDMDIYSFPLSPDELMDRLRLMGYL